MHLPPSFSPRATTLAILALCAGAAPALRAQQQPAAQLAPVDIRSPAEHGDRYLPASATTGLKIDAPLRDVPQTVNVVTREVIRDQGARSVQDVMKNVPGVGLAVGDGQRDALVIRGFTALSDILLDGVRDDAQYFRDLYNIDRIEVVKGPAAVLYGRGSSGGVVNLVTRKPGFAPSAEVGATVGSYGLKRGDVAINRPVGDTLALRLDAAAEDSDSYRRGAYIHGKAISPSLLWKDGAQSLLLQYNYQEQRRSIDFGVPGYRGRPAGVPISTTYGAANPLALDHANSTIQSSTARYELRLADETAFANTLRYYDYALDRRHTRVGAVQDTLAVPTVALLRGSVQRSEHGWFDQSELTHTLRQGDTSHKLLVGAEFSQQQKYQEVNNASPNSPVYAYRTPLFAPVGRNLPFAVPTASAQSPTAGLSTQTTRALYAQALSSWTPTVKTLVGLRYDRFGQTYDDRLPANADLHRTDGNVSPRAGVVWQPTQAQSYYASVTQSYQPSGEAQPLVANNAGLKPERSRNLEIGAKLDLLDGAASFTAALFQLTRSDVKYTDPVTNTLVNVGEQQSRGLELGFAGQVQPGWQVLAGYAYTDATVTRALGTTTAPFASATPTPIQGKTLAQTPRHTASLWTLKSLDAWLPGVQVGGGLTFRGANYAAIDNAVRLPSFATVDLAAYWRPAPRGVHLALNLKNVFDRRYSIAANNDLGILPGAPRTVELSARYAF